jgi:hypothetical protein
LCQFVFNFCQFKDSKLTHVLNYCQFCDFSPSWANCWLFCIIFHSLGLNKSNLASIEYLKCIIKCFYQFVFKFCQFWHIWHNPTWHICLIYCRFYDFGTSRANFVLFWVIFHSLRLNKLNLIPIECLKCIIKWLTLFVLMFCQFLDSKLPYLQNYYRFYYFDPSPGLFFSYFALLFTLWGRINQIWPLFRVLKRDATSEWWNGWAARSCDCCIDWCNGEEELQAEQETGSSSSTLSS